MQKMKRLINNSKLSKHGPRRIRKLIGLLLVLSRGLIVSSRRQELRPSITPRSLTTFWIST